MIDFFFELNALQQVILATIFTWGMTALGAALVFTTKKFNQRYLDFMLGFAGGVMIAASFWSLLSPALEMAEGGRFPAWVPVAIGFLLGGMFLFSVDKLLPHLHPNAPMKHAEGILPKKQKKKYTTCTCYYTS